MIKYKAYLGYCASIGKVEVIRETAQSVYFHSLFGGKEFRVAKRSSYDNYCDTWEEAHEILMADAQKRLDLARGELQTAKGRYGNVKGMKKPTEIVA